MLNSVRRGGIFSYQALRQAIIDTKQQGIVEQYLPEIGNSQPKSQSENCSKFAENNDYFHKNKSIHKNN